MKPEITNQFRIAVALAALSYKPLTQSLANYILDLKSHFALDVRDQVEAWRLHSLALEEKLKETGNEMQKKDSELDLLRAIIARSNSKSIPKSNDQHVPLKKKRPNQEPAESVNVPMTDWSAVPPALHGFDLAFIPPPLISSLQILSTMTKLDRATLRGQSPHYFLPSVKQCIMSSGEMLDHAMRQAHVPTSYPALMALRDFLPSLIRQALSLLPSRSLTSDIVDVFVRTMGECILWPIIQNVGRINFQRASVQLKPSPSQSSDRLSPPIDPRNTLLGICQDTINTMLSAPSLQSSLSLNVAQACIRALQKELTELYSTIKDIIFRRLVFRDTFWHIVSILRMAFSVAGRDLGSASLSFSPLEEAMKREVVSGLIVMLQPDHNGIHRLGLVERDMLIDLVEISWISGWASVHSEDAKAV